MMRLAAVYGLFAGFGLLIIAGCASSPVLTTPIVVPRTIPFASTAGASTALRDECLLETNFAEHLRAALAAEYQTVTQQDRITPATPGRALTARITQLLTLDNGAVAMTVEGVLRDNGRVIGSFTARQERPATRSGPVVTGMGHCGALLQVSKRLSKDIADWARQPGMNAQLGGKPL